jgi:hypothetical protein
MHATCHRSKWEVLLPAVITKGLHTDTRIVFKGLMKQQKALEKYGPEFAQVFRGAVADDGYQLYFALMHAAGHPQLQGYAISPSLDPPTMSGTMSLTA